MLVQVGESIHPSFRPGLEGGSSDDESFSGRGGPSASGIEHRRSAEGQVINPPVTGLICPSVLLVLVWLCVFSAVLIYGMYIFRYVHVCKPQKYINRVAFLRLLFSSFEGTLDMFSCNPIYLSRRWGRRRWEQWE